MNRESMIIGGGILLLVFAGIFYLMGYTEGLKQGYTIGMNQTVNATYTTDTLNMTCSTYPNDRAMCCSPIEIINGHAWGYKHPSGFNATYICHYNLTAGKFINCTKLG